LDDIQTSRAPVHNPSGLDSDYSVRGRVIQIGLEIACITTGQCSIGGRKRGKVKGVTKKYV